MTIVLQKSDLAASSFANTNSNGAGGVALRTDAGSAFRAELALNTGASLVGFIQPGAGAVPRTLQGKGEDVLSVKDFGAVGDGVTDDTAAIQAADTEAAIRNVSVTFPAGEFIAEGVTLTCAGFVGLPGATIKHKAGANGVLLSVSSPARIEGLTFDGNKANKSGLPYCIVANSPNVAITNNMFVDHFYKVVVLEQAQGSRVLSNRFESNGSVPNCNQVEVKCSNVSVVGNAMQDIGDGHCIRTGYFTVDTVREVRNVTIMGNTFKTSTHNGVTCELGSSEILILGNTFDALESGVKVEASPDAKDVSVIGNTFSNLTNSVGTCFNLTGDRSLFAENMIINCPSGPFFGNNGVCRSNRFYNSGTTAAYLVALSNTSQQGSTCTDNYFEGTTGGAVNLGNGSIIRGNRIRTTSEAAIRAYGVGTLVSENYIDGAVTGISVPSTFSFGAVSTNYIANCSTTNLSYAAGVQTNVVENNTGVAATVTARGISAGAIAVGQFDKILRVDTEAAAATDDLETLTGGLLGQQILLYSTSAARDITVKDAIGNIRLSADFVMGTTSDTLALYFNGVNWLEVSRSTNL